MQLVIAEKPSVARDLARVMGVRPAGRTHFESPHVVITWCVGHLAELEEPAAYDPRWKLWRLDTLPMIPPEFKLRPSTFAPEQYRAVRALLRDRRFGEVVNACDAGREGELIFRYVYQLAASRLPIRRLWISSLTDESIRRGLSALESGSRYDALADAARCRSEADWLVGLNATRALTARTRTGQKGTLYSIGRVQTPTLAMLTSREKAIRAFVPKSYWEVRGTFATSAGGRFHGLWTHSRLSRLATADLADTIVQRVKRHSDRADPVGPIVESLRTKTVFEPPPQLFDLTSLQRTANRRYGMSAAHTLEIAQSLYEKHKALTYPRTDSRHLTQDMARELPRVFNSLNEINAYRAFAEPLIQRPPGSTRRVFDDAKVSDHHAIIPTGKSVRLESLGPDERKIFDLVVRRFLGVFHPDAEFANTEVVVRVGPNEGGVRARDFVGEANEKSDASTDAAERSLDVCPPRPDRFVARGRVRIKAGWQDVAGIEGNEDSSERAGGSEPPVQALPRISEGERLDATFATMDKHTRPPNRYTEATLLGAMESAGKSIDDEALRSAMKDCGLGTPATRAAIIETLLKRGFVSRDKKALVATPLGIDLIESLPVESLASAELTGRWEERLARIARGQDSRARFMGDIATYVREVIETIRSSPPPSASAVASMPAGPPVGRCPLCGGAVVELVRGFVCGMGAKPCAFKMAKIVAGRAISGPLASVLLSMRKTQVLRGFKSKGGKRFAAALLLDAEGALRFSFGDGDAEVISGGAAGGSSARKKREQAAPKPRQPERPLFDVSSLVCPRCKTGTLITGKRGWGCSRWREGCELVVWFETAGKPVTASQLRELVTKGKTRKGKWRPGNGPPASGRLVLDATAKGGSVQFEAA